MALRDPVTASASLVVAGVVWLLLWAHQLAAHGTTEVNEEELVLGLTWMDSAKFFVVPFGLVLYAVVALRPRRTSTLGRVAFGATVLALVGLIVGSAIEFWPFDWGSYAEPADAPHAEAGGVVHALSSVALTVAMLVFAGSLVRAGKLAWWSGVLLALAAPLTIFLSPAFPVPGAAWVVVGVAEALRRGRGRRRAVAGPR